MTELLDFPDELLCKIFEYLNPFDALYSFINLNNRFNRLLIPFKQQIDLTYLSYQQFMYYINILLPMLNQEGSLNAMKLGNKRTPGQIKLLNKLICDENSRHYFNHIEKILVESPRLDELIEFVDQYLLSLSKLKILSIKIDYIRDEHFQRLTKLIINSIFSLTNLVKLSIEIPAGLVLAHLSNTVMFNSLIYVNLNLTLLTDLLLLIQHIPNVEILSICIGWWSSGDQTLGKMLEEMRLNNNQRSFLNRLKKFHLTINSIVEFQFEHLEQILFRIMNNRTTYSFSFILRNGFNRRNQSIQLIDGQQWENLLRIYSSLIQFNLFIRINGSIETDEEILKLNSFKSNYFIEKKWVFSYSNYLINNSTRFYSIPYKNKELFDILINDNVILNNFSVNYTPILSIDQINNQNYQSNQLTFDFILKYFPYLQELNLHYFNINSSIITPLDIPSLHVLKIFKERDINLYNLFQLFPFINTLFLSYFTLDDQSKSFDIYQYNRIIELSLIDIPEDNINQILVFLNQFPNLHYLHIHINNRRMTNGDLLRNLNEIIQKFPSLIYLKLQLGKDIESSIQWNEECNIPIKMRFSDVIFEGVLIHLWF